MPNYYLSRTIIHVHTPERLANDLLHHFPRNHQIIYHVPTTTDSSVRVLDLVVRSARYLRDSLRRAQLSTIRLNDLIRSGLAGIHAIESARGEAVIIDDAGDGESGCLGINAGIVGWRSE